MIQELLEVMRDCLFIGDEMVHTDEITPASYKDKVIQLADERSSHLTFIFHQRTGMKQEDTRHLSVNNLKQGGAEIMSKIADFNNSQVKVKESDRDRDHLIIDDLAHLRKDISNVGTAHSRRYNSTSDRKS